VISAEPLTRVAPVEPARMIGRTVIPWDKDDLDTLGFFKVDVLGLGMLTAIRKTLELIHDGRRAPGAFELKPFDPIDALAIPPEDPAVYDGICSGRHHRRLPDREPRADVDAAAPASRASSTTW
jgi:error-prone DNA polymerase